MTIPPNENMKVWLSRARQERRHRRDAVGALAVLDHHRLAPLLRQPFRDYAGGQVHAAARRQRDDEAHGPLRPGLRMRRRLHCSEQSGRGRHNCCRSNEHAHGEPQCVKLTETLPTGSSSNATLVSSCSTNSGGTTEPVMMTSPARSRSPKAASTSATWRTMPTISPVAACGSSVRAHSAPRRNHAAEQAVRPRAGARGVRRAEHDMALIDVAGQDRLDVVGRPVDDRRARWPGPSAAIAALRGGDVRACGRSRPMCTAISGSATGLVQPASEAVPPDGMRAGRIRCPTNGAVMPSSSSPPVRRSRPSSRAAPRPPRCALGDVRAARACRAQCADRPTAPS